jgi:hypothetical protein
LLGRRFSPALSAEQMNEVDWMEYHLHMYIQEEIILRNRLLAILNQARRIAESSGDSDGVKLLRDLKESIQKAFFDLSKVRAAHVHSKKWSDAQIRNFSSMILYSGMFEKIGMPKRFTNAMRGLKNREYMKLRKKWRLDLTENNKRIRTFCDEMFGQLADLLPKYQPVEHA